MEEWYKLYIQHLNQFPKLDDSWFQQTLVKARKGSKESREIIIGSSLWIVVDYTNKYKDYSSLNLADLMEEGNAVIPDVLEEFDGNSTDDYYKQLQDALKIKFDQYLSER